jgi:hypothetical protein
MTHPHDKPMPVSWFSKDRTKKVTQHFMLLDDGWEPYGDVIVEPWTDPDMSIEVHELKKKSPAKPLPHNGCHGARIYWWWKIRWIGVPDPLRERRFRDTPVRYIVYSPFRWMDGLMPPENEDGTYQGCGCIFRLKMAVSLFTRGIKMLWNA